MWGDILEVWQWSVETLSLQFKELGVNLTKLQQNRRVVWPLIGLNHT